MNKTDTHKMLGKDEMRVNSENFENALMYMASWTSTIDSILTFLRGEVCEIKQNYTFIDVGCGKGKVTLMARKSGIIGVEQESYIGIDFEPNLISIARINSAEMFGDEGTFLLEDVLKIDYEKFNGKLILFLYNPFDSLLMETFLKRVSALSPIIVYVNPVCRNSLIEQGYFTLTKRIGWHPNLSFEIFQVGNY